MPDLNDLDAPIRWLIEGLVRIVGKLPVKAIEFGYGDYNENGTPDVVVRVILQNGRKVELPALDVPFADVGKILELLSGLLPTHLQRKAKIG